LWTGCASTITPPEAPSDPITVHLVSSGRHAGLLLPCDDGRTVEYGYGEWGWYAQVRTAWWRAPLILLWPHQGTLGRRYVSGDDLVGDSYGGGKLEPIVVSGDKAARLLARLDAEFAEGGDPHYNRDYDMSFVMHPDRFSLLHNCHDEVVEWLRELGSSVSWTPVRRGLKMGSVVPD
jgi:hypothetical protein